MRAVLLCLDTSKIRVVDPEKITEVGNIRVFFFGAEEELNRKLEEIMNKILLEGFLIGVEARAIIEE